MQGADTIYCQKIAALRRLFSQYHHAATSKHHDPHQETLRSSPRKEYLSDVAPPELVFHFERQCFPQAPCVLPSTVPIFLEVRNLQVGIALRRSHPPSSNVEGMLSDRSLHRDRMP